MALAELVSPHLPYLRRFSRALTGSQESGDAYVEALLEAIVADPASARKGPDIKVVLYGLLCRLWESITVNLRGEEPSPAWERAAQLKQPAWEMLETVFRTRNVMPRLVQKGIIEG